MNASGCWVGFLRAINVGGRQVTMGALRDLLDGLRLGTVSTFIASGNVIFDGAQGDEASIRARVEGALVNGLGYEVDTFVRSIEKVAALSASPPFPPLEGVSVNVGFLHKRPSATAMKAVQALGSAEDQLELQGRELWWARHGRISDSPIATNALGKALGQPTTMRNVRTLERIAARYAR